MENIDWGNIIAIAFGLIATLLGGKWLLAKNKLNQLKNAAKESYEAIAYWVEALADDKLTKEEQAKGKIEVLEAWGAIKILLGLKKKE